MSIKIRSNELSPAEASFLKWQYGFDEEDEPFARALWQAIGRAWDADAVSGGGTRHLERLGSKGAYPEEVALYASFKREGGDAIWNELIRRAGLSDRRRAKVEPPIDRRRRGIEVRRKSLGNQGVFAYSAVCCDAAFVGFASQSFIVPDLPGREVLLFPQQFPKGFLPKDCEIGWCRCLGLPTSAPSSIAARECPVSDDGRRVFFRNRRTRASTGMAAQEKLT